MSATPPTRKRHLGPDLGLAPGERGFAKWLKQTIADAEEEAKREGTMSSKEWLARTEQLLADNPKTKRGKAG